MKKFIKPMTVAAVLGTTCTFAADSDVDARLERLEQQFQELQRENAELKGAMSGQQYLTHEEAARLIQNEMSAMVDERVEAGLAQMRDSSPILTLGKNIDGLSIKGDLRLRYERREKEYDGSDQVSRDRYRVRLRIGGVWKSEGWEVGLGLATGSYGGDYDDGSATSTNQTYNSSSIFQTNNINLDYAYAKHTWGDLSVTAGQMKNPFEGSWIMWDSDVRPVGIVAHYEYQGFFVTGGILPTITVEGGEDSGGYLSAIQIGYEGSYDQLDYLVATSYYYFNKATIDDLLIDVSDYDYGFEIWDLYGELSYKMNDVKIGLHGHFLYNFGADGLPSGMSSQTSVPGDYDAEDNNIAWLLGGSVGYAGFKVKYDYAHIEADSSFGALHDSDFGTAVSGFGAADAKGHKVGVSYAVNKNLTLSGTAIFVKTIDGTSSNDEGQLYQVDAVWKF